MFSLGSNLWRTTMMLFNTLNTKEKAKEFRNERLNKIDNGKVWSPMSEGPYYVLHWLPISEKTLFESNDPNLMNFSKFIPIKGNKVEVPNLDGVRIYSGPEDKSQTTSNSNGEALIRRFFWNAQMFHSCVLEIAVALCFHTDTGGKKWIYIRDLVKELWGVMDGFKECISSYNKNISVIVGISLLRALGCRLFRNHGGFFNSHAHSDREQIILPGMLIENLEKVENIEEIERPIFDMMWRSFGLEKCDCYDDDGKRKTLNEI